MDLVLPERNVSMALVSGMGHYEEVVRRVRQAEQSVWISTANLKSLMVRQERPGAARRDRYRSVVELFDGLARGGVELRILHARLPSRAFCDAFDRHPRLVQGGLELRQCPRVHFKAVVVDGAFLYLGSANWTGAAMGLRGTTRRNFELGFATRDDGLLDLVQGLFDEIWSGRRCAECSLRDSCEAPLDLS